MPSRRLQFYPIEGQRNSPVDSLKDRCSVNEQARILQKLAKLQELDMNLWHAIGGKQIRGFWQIRQGDFRIYLKLHEEEIVVLHVCRKTSQKMKEEDFKIAENNFRLFLEEN